MKKTLTAILVSGLVILPVSTVLAAGHFGAGGNPAFNLNAPVSPVQAQSTYRVEVRAENQLQKQMQVNQADLAAENGTGDLIRQRNQLREAASTAVQNVPVQQRVQVQNQTRSQLRAGEVVVTPNQDRPQAKVQGHAQLQLQNGSPAVAKAQIQERAQVGAQSNPLEQGQACDPLRDQLRDQDRDQDRDQVCDQDQDRDQLRNQDQDQDQDRDRIKDCLNDPAQDRDQERIHQ